MPAPVAGHKSRYDRPSRSRPLANRSCVAPAASNQRHGPGPSLTPSELMEACGAVRCRVVSAAGMGGESDDLEIHRDLVSVRTGQGGVELGWLAGEQLVGVGDAAGAGERPELKGQPVGGQWRRAVHHVEVQVWEVGVAAVTDQPQDLTRADPIADVDPEA